MIKRISHIGIAVASLEASGSLFSKLFENPLPIVEHVPRQQAHIAFYPVGESSVELIESMTKDSSVSKFIQKRGEGIHHICLEVEGLDQEIQRLTKHGFQFVTETPTEGGDGFRVVFLHPKSTGGVLIELAEKSR
ncbi:MAG: methylmalonyl-CoA epimerase [Bacteroidota bacterium]|jgi:methylmalonyl-CoA/ethylmalonyl-CoA epimerase